MDAGNVENDPTDIDHASNPEFWMRELAERTEAARRKYKGHISAHAPRSEIGVHMIRMQSLMAEWNPIGCRVQDLVSIIGEPTKSDENIYYYRFDNGFTATHWSFTIEHGKVFGIRAE